MRTFIACCGIDGRAGAVEQLTALAQQRRPDAILFAGGLFEPTPPHESLTAVAERRHCDTRLLEQFFAALGELKSVAAVIPGPHDAPLRAILMAGMNARSQWQGVHLVHCTLVTARDIVISGVGGELTRTEDSGDPVVRCSRTTAQYFLQAFSAANESEKVLLLAAPPKGELGGDAGSELIGELIDSYHPKLCVVAGATAHRGVQRIAHTTIVNPGRLSDGSAAWVDWNREVDEQVELIKLG